MSVSGSGESEGLVKSGMKRLAGGQIKAGT